MQLSSSMENDVIQPEEILRFASPHLTEKERIGFELHANGATTKLDMEGVGGWMIYWGFYDALTHSRSIAPGNDSYYDRGQKLGVAFLLEQSTPTNREETDLKST